MFGIDRTSEGTASHMASGIDGVCWCAETNASVFAQIEQVQPGARLRRNACPGPFSDFLEKDLSLVLAGESIPHNRFDKRGGEVGGGIE